MRLTDYWRLEAKELYEQYESVKLLKAKIEQYALDNHIKATDVPNYSRIVEYLNDASDAYEKASTALNTYVDSAANSLM